MSPWWLLILWLIYLLSPIDLFPDVPPVGWTDDILLLIAGLLYSFLLRKRGPDQSTDWSETDYEESGQSYRSTNENKGQTGKRQKETKDPYTILGVDRSATMEEIRKAYRVQANRYHPDKVSHLGEEFQKLAHKKFQDIQWAYDYLLKEKGKP